MPHAGYEEQAKITKPRLVAIGTVIDPVPVTGLGTNFWSVPGIATPPAGREMKGIDPADAPPFLPVYSLSSEFGACGSKVIILVQMHKLLLNCAGDSYCEECSAHPLSRLVEWD